MLPEFSRFGWEESQIWCRYRTKKRFVPRPSGKVWGIEFEGDVNVKKEGCQRR